jgi:hypothetical protein
VIVRSGDEAALHLIRQPDHAHLAGAIMAQCRPLDTRQRRPSILRAIAEHDNGWTEEDETPLFNEMSGGVYDFMTAPLAVRLRVWPRGVARLAAVPWTAALVAQHADTIYDRYHSDPDWRTFFADIRRRRDALVAETGLTLEDLVDDYAFVRLGDLISLAFCTGWPEEHRFDKVTVRPAGTRVIVSPDLFGRPIPIEITARSLPNVRYRSASALTAAFSNAPLVTIRGEVTSQ